MFLVEQEAHRLTSRDEGLVTLMFWVSSEEIRLLSACLKWVNPKDEMPASVNQRGWPCRVINWPQRIIQSLCIPRNQFQRICNAVFDSRYHVRLTIMTCHPLRQIFSANKMVFYFFYSPEYWSTLQHLLELLGKVSKPFVPNPSVKGWGVGGY